MEKKPKPHYGIDAPKVIRNLLVIGVLLLLIAFFLPGDSSQWSITNIIKNTVFYPGIYFVIGGLLIILYAKWEKFRQRERILNLHEWKGDETVLDVGAGRGAC